MGATSLIFAYLLFLIQPAPFTASTKPEIGVKFKITEESYRTSFRQLITEIEKEGQEKIAAILGDEIRYISFVPGESNYTLKITLENPEGSGSAGSLKQAGFRIQLEATDEDINSGSNYWIFLDKIDYQNTSYELHDVFMNAICVKIKENLQEAFNKDNLVALLFNIPIAEEAILCIFENEPYFLIPVQANDDRFGMESEFEVSSEVVTPTSYHTPKKYKVRIENLTENTINWTALNCNTTKNKTELEEKYCDGKINAKAYAPENELNKVRCGKNIKVKVIKYIHIKKDKDENEDSSETGVAEETDSVEENWK